MAEEDTMVQDMMGMMMVIMMVAVLSQIIPGQVQAAPANRNVTVTLRNPPSGAELWQLILTDWDITVAIYQIGGLALVDVAELIMFEIPDGVVLPLRVMSLQVSKWNEDKTALVVLYEIQSYRPYLWDFGKNDWGDEPDPSYREAFLDTFGSSYYDVQLEAFTTG